MHELRLAIPAELEGSTVREAALKALRMSYAQFKRAKFEGEILLDGARSLANARLKAGQMLVVRVPEREAERARRAEQSPAPTAVCVPERPEPCDMRLCVAYEDDDILLVDKPAPLPSASSARQTGATLENAVFEHMGSPDGFVYRPVNRLDKGTSGLMAIAKNAHAQQLMQRCLHSDRFVREYIAVVEGEPPQTEGVIDLPIGKADGATIRREVRADGAPSRTFYRVLQKENGRSLLRLRLDTGRTHQIRVHMQALGCPVAGDFLYGHELSELPGRFALHSAYLRVEHPLTGAIIELESPLPAEIEGLMGCKRRD